MRRVLSEFAADRLQLASRFRPVTSRMHPLWTPSPSTSSWRETVLCMSRRMRRPLRRTADS